MYIHNIPIYKTICVYRYICIHEIQPAAHQACFTSPSQVSAEPHDHPPGESIALHPGTATVSSVAGQPGS